MNEKKIRIVKDKHLAGGLAWLGFWYDVNENGHFVFERSLAFDRTFKDMHAIRALNKKLK